MSLYSGRYNISLAGSVDDSLAADDGTGDTDGAGINNYFDSADFICREGDDDVLHYGFPLSASLLRPPRDRRARDDAALDDDDALDSISMSLCESSAASEVDLTGDICEIEDSEANASDLDDELRPLDAPSAH